MDEQATQSHHERRRGGRRPAEALTTAETAAEVDPCVAAGSVGVNTAVNACVSITLWNRTRRAATVPQQRVMDSDGVVLDGPRRCALVDGHVVHLSARETAVLGALMARAGQVVYRPTLAAAAWGIAQADHGALDRLLSRLRRRIEPSPLSPARLRHVGDVGYIFGSTPAPTLSDRLCPDMLD